MNCKMIRSTFVYICLLLCVSIFTASVKNEEIIDPRKILLVFHNCNATIDVSTKCIIKDIDCIEKAYNQIKKNNDESTVFIHGYRGSKNTIPVPYIVSAYCSRNISIIVLLDWSKLAQGDVLKVTKRIPMIGKITASAFNSLSTRGYKMAKWHLIGHSMGAHVVGCIGTYSDFTFLHITGLDPAGLLFYSDSYDGCRINPKVAHFTDVFYTDRGGYGTMKNVGTLNIYANTGSAPQPDCCSAQWGPNACSHIKAAEWYADAVRNETKYSATKCEDCFTFLNSDYCYKNDRIYLGPYTDKKATGTYCLPINLKKNSFLHDMKTKEVHN